MRKKLIRWALRFNMTRNRAVLLRIANLPPTGNVMLTGDEEKLLNLMVKLVLPSQVVTRNGKAVYRVKSIDEMGLWAVLEARRAEDAIGRIEAWTSEEYTPKTVIDAAKLDKFIKDEATDTYTNETIDAWNHALDAIRYGVDYLIRKYRPK